VADNTVLRNCYKSVVFPFHENFFDHRLDDRRQSTLENRVSPPHTPSLPTLALETKKCISHSIGLKVQIIIIHI